MPFNWFLFFILCSGLFFGLGLFATCLAWIKGYRLWFWLVPLGPIGALLMLFRPNLNRATTPEERETWEQRADWTGGVLSGITLFVGMAVSLLGFVALFGIRMVGVAPPPPPPFPSTPSWAVQAGPDEMLAPDPQESPAEPSQTEGAAQEAKPTPPNEPSAEVGDGVPGGP